MPRFPEVPLDGLLRAAAAAHPNRVAVRTATSALTFAELDARATAWANVLRRRKPGAVVAVHALLEPRFAVAYYGTVRAGGVVVTLNPFLPAHIAATLLAGARVDLALVTDEFVPQLSQFGGDVMSIAVLDDAAPDADLGLDVDLDDAACVHFTSGTTGMPKAVLLSHRNLTTNAWQIAEAHQLTPESVTANHLPTYHPMHLNSAVAAGATQVLCQGDDPAEAVELAATHGATHFYSLPVRLSRLAAHERLAGLAVPTLRVIASGGSALPVAAATALGKQFGVPVIQGYGLAETSPLTHSDRIDAAKPGSVGPVVAQTECRVVDLDTREVLGADQVGEVQVRGPQVMKGYLDERLPAVDADGWLDTGDVGRVDADGYLFLVDRIKDVFKCDNWLVAPSSIERRLTDRPEIRDCCVVDVPDEARGAVAHALVVPAPGRDPAAAVAAVNERSPYYERVADFIVVTEIPRSGNGKVSRAQLRGRFTNPMTEGRNMITLVNKFVVSGDTAEFERIWKSSSDFMRQQPGFISFQLVRSISDPTVYINIARWADAESHQRVMRGEAFREHIVELGKVARPEPHLCEVVIEHAAA
jgi:long-chain acyl-CoA synthetase